MRISIIIPAHNEEKYLASCLSSFVAQTLQPDELIVVDDNSSDNTYKIALEFAQKQDWIKVFQRKSSNEHIPGKKVVDTFNFGLQHVSDYDLLGKFDADIILPKNYFEMMRNHFQSNWKLGMCSGLLYIEKEGNWVYENIADKSHVRGPIKLYHKACFKKIGGLRPATGWDTVDTLLAKYHDFETLTDATLQVKHLRHLGQDYKTKNYFAKGEALYKMRYDIVLAKLAALKMAWSIKSPRMYVQMIFGYLNAFFKNTTRFVTKEEGRFIRKLRWKGIKTKLF
ncbi:glycosyltransferase [uncultured Croceitalea sp.]|uniref:glycosyltransferase family 2 protein n=1 Tax=uncultured Croceitalea sp. TaxID=1798908 RepID=UPI003305FAB4